MRSLSVVARFLADGRREALRGPSDGQIEEPVLTAGASRKAGAVHLFREVEAKGILERRMPPRVTMEGLDGQFRQAEAGIGHSCPQSVEG